MDDTTDTPTIHSAKAAELVARPSEIDAFDSWSLLAQREQMSVWRFRWFEIRFGRTEVPLFRPTVEFFDVTTPCPPEPIDVVEAAPVEWGTPPLPGPEARLAAPPVEEEPAPTYDDVEWPAPVEVEEGLVLEPTEEFDVILPPEPPAEPKRPEPVLEPSPVFDLDNVAPPPDMGSTPAPVPRLRVAPEPTGQPGPMIHTLGPFMINGVHYADKAKPWKYTKTPELILYLSLRPHGVTAHDAMEALWPGEEPNQSRLNQVMSDARRKALGGEEWLPQVSPINGVYKLVDVDLDIARFIQLVAKANRTDEIDDRRDLLIDALELVVGRPFDTGDTGYAWLDLDRSQAEVTIDQAATDLIEIAMAQGDGELAMWAADRALLQWSENQTFLVAHARGALLAEDPVGIAAAFARLGALEDEEIWPETRAGLVQLDEARGRRRGA